MEDLFDKAANKSLQEIKEISDPVIQREAIRYWFNRLLIDNNDENPLEISFPIIITTGEEQGLSTNDMHRAVGFSMTEGEGFINIWIDGSSEPLDMDCFSNECLIDIIEQYEQKK